MICLKSHRHSKTGKLKSFLLSGIVFLLLSPAAHSNGTLSPANANSSKSPFQIVAETVWVDIKNQMAVTKVVQVFKNGSDSPTEASFNFPFGEKDTLVDFALFKNGQPLVPEEEQTGDSAELFASAAPPVVDSSPEPKSLILPAPIGKLAPGETLSVLLVYQSRLNQSGENFRYTFPLKPAEAKTSIGSFTFSATLQEESRIMGVKTEGYPIVVRGNGKKYRAYFWQNNLTPNRDLGLSYRVLNSSANSKN